MKSKLKTNLIMMEVIFLLIVVGGSTVVYQIFAPDYYSRAKARLMREAFAQIQEMDLTQLDGEDREILERYEEEHLFFAVTDRDFVPVYLSASENPEHTVKKHIRLHQEEFSLAPEVIQINSRSFEGGRLRGLAEQAGLTYYIYIRELTRSPYSAFFYTERFLIGVVVLAVLAGSLAMYGMGRRIARPIETMAVVSKRLAEHDFSARVREETSFTEVNTLAKNFNTMASQMQYYIQELEKHNQDLASNNVRLQEERVRQERLEQMRRAHNANISHELKTPLAVIASQVEMLQVLEKEPTEKSSYYFASIQEEIAKMSELVGGLLKVFAAEHELEELEWEPVNLSETAEYLMLKYDALFRKKGIQRSCRIERDCLVYADQSCMEKAMGNYLLNALGHAGNGGKLAVTVEREDGQVFFRVYNDGPEIAEADMPHIWDSYYQGRRREDHAGLGLYLVKTILVLHKGQYRAENQKKGVEFWFSLPVLEKEQ